MQTDPSPTAEKPPKLRWYQYRLRSLFVLTTLVAVGMSWLTVTMQNQRKQKAAAEAIEKAGGWPTYETTWLGKLLRDDSLVTVTRASLGESTTDEWLANLQSMNDLQELMVQKTNVSGAGLAHLQGLNQLQLLDLFGSKVNDVGLAQLQGFRRLQLLGLQDTNVSDAGLAHLRRLSQLQQLVLTGTKVTDAGLVHLQGLSQLQALYLANTKITNDGVRKLHQALPNCKILR
jgi:hypothetical protein